MKAFKMYTKKDKDSAKGSKKKHYKHCQWKLTNLTNGDNENGELRNSKESLCSRKVSGGTSYCSTHWEQISFDIQDREVEFKKERPPEDLARIVISIGNASNAEHLICIIKQILEADKMHLQGLGISYINYNNHLEFLTDFRSQSPDLYAKYTERCSYSYLYVLQVACIHGLLDVVKSLYENHYIFSFDKLLMLNFGCFIHKDLQNQAIQTAATGNHVNVIQFILEYHFDNYSEYSNYFDFITKREFGQLYRYLDISLIVKNAALAGNKDVIDYITDFSCKYFEESLSKSWLGEFLTDDFIRTLAFEHQKIDMAILVCEFKKEICHSYVEFYFNKETGAFRCKNTGRDTYYEPHEDPSDIRHHAETTSEYDVPPSYHR